MTSRQPSEPTVPAQPVPPQPVPPQPVPPQPVLRPTVLRRGDLVAVVSPAGPADPHRVARGVALLTGWGLRTRIGTHAYAPSGDRRGDRPAGSGSGDRAGYASGRVAGYLAGTDAQRLGDLDGALADPDVRGVICTRGGYGAQRIADAVDLAPVRRDPKVVVGFSDITALHLALWRGAGLATVHGPGAAWRDGRTPAASADSLRAALMTTDPVVLRADPDAESAGVRAPGRATGTLLGGNLAILASSMGTPGMPDLRDAVLLLEDVAEPPYRIDRMLTQLRRGGALTVLAGVAVGQFTGCGPAEAVAGVLVDRLADLGVPVLGGLPVGHGPGQLTVPLGVPATLDVDAGTLTVAPAVQPG